MSDIRKDPIRKNPLRGEFHSLQGFLLSATFKPVGYAADQIFTANSLNLYYNPSDPEQFQCPDWLAVVGISSLDQGKYLRQSYVSWQEGANPIILIEGWSDIDLEIPTQRWEVYEQILQIPYYILFEPESNQIQAYKWWNGHFLQIPPSNSQVWIEELQIGLGLWQGFWVKQERFWLRWFDADGRWIPTPVEQLELQIIQERMIRLEAEQLANQKTSISLAAEQDVNQEILARLEAEKRAYRETIARLNAEQRANQEMIARLEAEQQIKRLEQQLLQTGMDPVDPVKDPPADATNF